jgi:signal transduction histidine kinase
MTYLAIAVAFYMVTEYLIYEEVESRLKSEKRDFVDYVKRNNGVWYNSCYFVENKIDLQPVSQAPVLTIENFSDTLLIDKYSDEHVPFRQIHFYSKMGDQYFHVSIRKSLLESDKLLRYLTTTIFILLSVAFSIMYFFQRRNSKKIWNPFYKTLLKIKSFELAKDKELQLQSGGIYEFEELNSVLQKMSRKMRQDYKGLKEFTENASHEMQTPLALINIRAEELIQSKTLTEKEIYLINDIYNSSARISKITQSLLLLSKIENEQFTEKKPIDFDYLLQLKISEFEEIFHHSQLKIKYEKKEKFLFEMNADLADILLTNLISNAVKHNLKHGEITISVFKNGFKISNTGSPLDIDPRQLFLRFKKGKHGKDSSGLGLAIVKQICSNYGLAVDYTYNGQLHILTILKS